MKYYSIKQFSAFAYCANWLNQKQECDENNTFFSLFVCLFFTLRSDQIVYPFTTVPTYINRCLKWEKLTEFSYTYLIYKGMYFSNQIYINFKHADFNVGFFNFQSPFCL